MTSRTTRRNAWKMAYSEARAYLHGQVEDPNDTVCADCELMSEFWTAVYIVRHR